MLHLYINAVRIWWLRLKNQQDLANSAAPIADLRWNLFSCIDQLNRCLKEKPSI